MTLTSKIAIGWENWIPAATLSAGSALATAPVANLQSGHVATKWETAAGVKSSYFIADFGAAKTVQGFALVGTNLTPSATRRLRGSLTDPTGAAGEVFDTGTGSAGIDALYRCVYVFLANPVSVRYLRCDLDDLTLADNLKAGRCFAGPVFQPARNRSYGASIVPRDLTRRDVSRGGQDFVDEGERFRVAQFSLDWLTKAEALESALVLALSNGMAKEVLFCDNPLAAALSPITVFGLLEELAPIVQERLPQYRTRYTVKQRL